VLKVRLPANTPRSHWPLSVFLVIAAVANSCAAKYEKGARFNYQDDVGFAKVSVVSVIPWTVVENALSPGFNLTGDQAVTEVAQAGRSEEDTISSTFNLAVQGNFSPGGGGAGALPSASSTGSVKKAASTDTKSGGGAQASSAASPESSPSGAASPSASPSSGTKESNPPATGLSALTKYQLAASLYQEVKLLNLYVKHIAQSQNVTPYLVSLDVNMFTSSPKAEVNSLVVISFQWIKKGVYQWSPAIIPVISSEDIELNQHTNSVHNLLTLAAALAGTSPTGLGGSIKSSETLDKLSKLAGRDVN
jgi:hypothetical protein